METYQIIKSTPSSIHIQQTKINNCDSKKKEEEAQKQLQQQQQQQEIVDNAKNRDEEKIKNLKDSIPEIDNIFNIRNRIGSGTFSTVFLANLKEYNNETSNDDKNVIEEKRKLFAIKHIIPTSSPQRIVKELKCLVDIGGVDNIIGIKLCLRCNENVAFVMPYIEHDKFQTYFEKMILSEVQLYMKNLLIAIRRVHKFNIIHRDVKPSNFLYNRKTKEFLLIDFGLAQNVINRSDREASLLKRKLNDDRNLTSDINVTNSSSNNNNNNKKICFDKNIDDQQQKSPDKMPLKQLNGLQTSISMGLSTTSTTIGIADCSGEQSNKNSKSESPNNNINTQLEKETIIADSGIQRRSKTNNLYQRTNTTAMTSSTAATTITVNEQYLQQANLTYMNATNSSSIHQQQQQQQQHHHQNKCHCYGKPQVCKICLIRKEIPASRAGTPGYRPPEVLLKYTDQTTAVDVWAVGVIFISILSGVYPFFKAPDDFAALAEIVMLFGDEVVRKTAFTLGRQITMTRKCKPLNLRRLCVRLRNRSKIDRNELLLKYVKNGKKFEECSNCQQVSYDCICQTTKYKLEDVGQDIFPDSAYDLLKKLLEVNPHKRINAAKALQHPFLREKFD